MSLAIGRAIMAPVISVQCTECGKQLVRSLPRRGTLRHYLRVGVFRHLSECSPGLTPRERSSATDRILRRFDA